MTDYDRLRSIGCSVETADALAPVVETLTPKKREAFYLWAMGMTMRDIAKMTGIPKSTIHDIIKKLSDKCHSRVIRR